MSSPKFLPDIGKILEDSTPDGINVSYDYDVMTDDVIFEGMFEDNAGDRFKMQHSFKSALERDEDFEDIAKKWTDIYTNKIEVVIVKSTDTTT